MNSKQILEIKGINPGSHALPNFLRIKSLEHINQAAKGSNKFYSMSWYTWVLMNNSYVRKVCADHTVSNWHWFERITYVIPAKNIHFLSLSNQILNKNFWMKCFLNTNFSTKSMGNFVKSFNTIMWIFSVCKISSR